MEEKKVKDLKEHLELLEVQANKIKKLKDEFVESVKNEVLIKSGYELHIADLKYELTTEALAEFEESGNKKLYGGIGIKQMKTLSYPADKALKFAKEKDMFLTLDKKAFDKVAVSLNLDFVESGTENKVTFPKVIKLEE